MTRLLMTRRLKISVIVLTAVVATVFVFGGPFLAYWRQWSLTTETFRKRANDVQPLIAAIYRHSFERGKWPENIEALSDARFDPLRNDWEYVRWSESESPVLRTQGSVHTKLEYWFRDRGDRSSPGGWRCRCEGDSVKFQCEESIPPRPQ